MGPASGHQVPVKLRRASQDPEQATFFAHGEPSEVLKSVREHGFGGDDSERTVTGQYVYPETASPYFELVIDDLTPQ